MSITTEKELREARERFAEIINRERAKVGLPPQAAEVVTKPVDPYMERWKMQGGGDQTQVFIQMNADRVARGLRPLGASGVEIGADAPIVVADFDNDGKNELVVVGRSYEWCQGGEVSRHNGIYIVNRDRTRWNVTIGTVLADWREAPQPTNITGGKNPCCSGMYSALNPDYNVIQSANIAPVVGDIDGDNVLEALYSSYDGKIHCWWADKHERYNWPVTIGTPSALRLASPPVLVDLDNDGFSEIIVATWGPNAGLPGREMGKIHILDYQGNRLANISLPDPGGSLNWNGVMGSLTATDLDGNGKLDLVGVSSNTGVVRFEVEGSIGFRILWGTGRGSYGRYGEAPATVRNGPLRSTVLGNNDFGAGMASGLAAPLCLLLALLLLLL